jgi:hypothetical protein
MSWRSIALKWWQSLDGIVYDFPVYEVFRVKYWQTRYAVE